MADVFYRAALYAEAQGSKFALTEEENKAWSDVLSDLGDKPSADKFKTVMTAAGDAVMTRLYHHVKDDGFHLAEQIDRNNGAQISAKDLTWSYAAVLKAFKRR